MIKLCLPGEAELPEEFQVELLVEVVQASSLGLKVDAKCRTTGWILEDGE
jgi:hypothetical protein